MEAKKFSIIIEHKQFEIHYILYTSLKSYKIIKNNTFLIIYEK